MQAIISAQNLSTHVIIHLSLLSGTTYKVDTV